MSSERNFDYKKPIYLQLREIIRSKIEENDYPPGTAIPSENELADTYEINRLTVRSAIDALVNEGLLKRIQGKGVYVMSGKVSRDLETLSGFSQTIREKNATPSTKILAKTVRTAGSKYAKIFGVSPSSKLYYVKRISYYNGEPMGLEEIYIPFDIVPKLSGIDLSVFSLYEIYGFYNIDIKRATETLDLVRLDANESRVLGIDGDSTVMLFTSVTYDAKGRAVEYARNYVLGNKCEFTVNFHN